MRGASTGDGVQSRLRIVGRQLGGIGNDENTGNGRFEAASVNRQFAAVLALLALSCSRTVELGGVPQLTSSTDPTVLGNINERVTAIQVDDERVYWIGTEGIVNAIGDSALRSCNKRHCVGSLVTYDATGVNAETKFSVENGQIYWLHLLTDGAMTWALQSCDVRGCQGAPRVVAPSVAEEGYPTVSVFTPDAFYFSYDGVSRVPLAATGATPEFVLNPGNSPTSLAVQGDYLYWVLNDLEGIQHGSDILRQRLDGSGSAEPLAANVDIDIYYRAAESWLTVDTQYVYWSQGGLAGSIARCPLTGCVGAPELFAGPVRSPTVLQLAGDELYWEHDTNLQGFAVSGCKRAQCVPSAPLAFGIDDVGPLAFDDQYFYTATVTRDPDRRSGVTDIPAQIRRIPR